MTFNVRADLVRRSLPQLKWLLEMTASSTVTVISSTPAGTDPSPLPLHDLAYVRRRVPRHAIFYDLPRANHVDFSSVKDATVTDSHNRDVVQIDEERAFNADQWKVRQNCLTVHDAAKIFQMGKSFDFFSEVTVDILVFSKEVFIYTVSQKVWWNL